MSHQKDDKGFNQIWKENKSTIIRKQRRSQWIIDEMKISSETNILEIGCGTGDISNYIATHTPAQMLGTDICMPFLEEAKAKYNLPNLKFDYLDFNKPDALQGKKFDYIIGNGILHHLYYQLDEALVNIRFLLKDGGKLIFLEPNLVNPYCYVIFTYPYFRKKASLEPDEMAFTKTFIQDKLQKAGYTSSKVVYKDFLLPVIPDALIKPVILVGDLVEKIPLLNKVTQSIFIVGNK